MADQRFGVGEGVSMRSGDEVIDVNPSKRLKGSAQLPAFGIFSAKSDKMNIWDPQRHQIVQDGAGSSRLAPHLINVVDLQSRFDGDFSSAGVNLKVAIQTDITDNAEPEMIIACLLYTSPSPRDRG